MDASKLPATTQTARDALNQTNLAAEELRRSLTVIRDSLAEFRELARMLANNQSPWFMVDDLQGETLMIKWPQFFLLIAIALPGGTACRLRPPQTTPVRMIEPLLVEPPMQERALLEPNPSGCWTPSTRTHRSSCASPTADGELVEDAIWRWSSAPIGIWTRRCISHWRRAPTYVMSMLPTPQPFRSLCWAWHLESAGETRLVGAIELQLTTNDRVVHTHVVRDSESVSAELPGDLAAAAAAFCAAWRPRASHASRPRRHKRHCESDGDRCNTVLAYLPQK
jgi:hypothetical protein